jgi:hypothetical protein
MSAVRAAVVAAIVAMVGISLQGCNGASMQRVRSYASNMTAAAQPYWQQAANATAGYRAHAGAYFENASSAARAKLASPEVQQLQAQLQQQAQGVATQAQGAWNSPQMQAQIQSLQQQAQAAQAQAQAYAQQHTPQAQQYAQQLQAQAQQLQAQAVQQAQAMAAQQAQAQAQQVAAQQGVAPPVTGQFEIFGADGGSKVTSHVNVNSGIFVVVSGAFLLGTGALALAIRRARAPTASNDEEPLVQEEGMDQDIE